MGVLFEDRFAGSNPSIRLADPSIKLFMGESFSSKLIILDLRKLYTQIPFRKMCKGLKFRKKYA